MTDEELAPEAGSKPRRFRLGVCVPTYDRLDCLREYLPALLRQLTPDCVLHVIDNCSPTPVAGVFGELTRQFPNAQCRLTRNPVNIGGNGNICRCFESVDADWVWILGDDDLVRPGAIEAVLADVERYPDAVAINYSAPGLDREEARLIVGLQGVVDTFDEPAYLGFISSMIYNTAKVVVNLKWAYQYSYSYGPHVALLLVSLQGSNHFVQSPAVIAEPTKGHGDWAAADVMLCTSALYELPMTADLRTRLRRRMSANFPFGMSRCMRELSLKGTSEENIDTSVYLWDQLWLRHYRPLRLWWTRLPQYWLYRFLISRPKLAARVTRVVYRLRGVDAASRQIGMEAGYDRNRL